MQLTKRIMRCASLRFSLRTLLATTTIIALAIALLTSKATKQRRAVAMIHRARGLVEYDYQYGSSDAFQHPLLKPRRGKLASLFGDELFGQVVRVRIRPHSKADLELATIDLWRSIGSLSALESLELRFMPIDDAGLCEISAVTQLRFVDLMGAQATDRGMVCIGGMGTLEKLNLAFTNITDAGVSHLKTLTALRHLNLTRTRITDASIDALSQFRNLRWLSVCGTHLTSDGASELRRLMPSCRILATTAKRPGGEIVLDRAQAQKPPSAPAPTHPDRID